MPAVGRFLSADPNVLIASDLQSYNRFSYGANNPLKYTDPTGYYNYWREGLGQFVNFALGVTAIALCPASGGASCAMAFALAGTVINTTAALASGTPWDSVVASQITGLGFSTLGGTIGASLGGTGFAEIAGSAIGGGVAAAYTRPVGARGDLGDDIALGAMQGAFYAALRVAAGNAPPLSQSEAQEGPNDAATGSGGTQLAGGQARVDRAYDELGLEYGKRPRFDPTHLGSNAQTQRGGVVVGPTALESEDQLKTTLIHERVHVIQWAEGRLGASGLARQASELEARLQQLEYENVQRAGLSPDLEATLVRDVTDKIENLFQFGADRYVFQALVLGKVTPPTQFVMQDPAQWMHLAK